MTGLPTSPLSAASPASLDAYFAADPQTFTDPEFLVFLTELRRRRVAFVADDHAKSEAVKPTRTRATAVPPAVAARLDKPVGELSLDDLLNPPEGDG